MWSTVTRRSAAFGETPESETPVSSLFLLCPQLSGQGVRWVRFKELGKVLTKIEVEGWVCVRKRVIKTKSDLKPPTALNYEGV